MVLSKQCNVNHTFSFETAKHIAAQTLQSQLPSPPLSTTPWLPPAPLLRWAALTPAAMEETGWFSARCCLSVGMMYQRGLPWHAWVEKQRPLGAEVVGAAVPTVYPQMRTSCSLPAITGLCLHNGARGIGSGLPTPPPSEER